MSALREALATGPIDPHGAGGPFTKYAKELVDSWSEADPFFKEKFNCEVGEENSDALSLYLAVCAFSLANAATPFSDLNEVNRARLEKDAGTTLFDNLIDTHTPDEVHALQRTWQTLTRAKNLHFLKTPIPEVVATTTAEHAPSDPGKIKLFHEYLAKQLAPFKARLAESGQPPEIRDMLEVFNNVINYCAEIGLKNPPVQNFTIGDINLLRADIEPEYAGLAQKLGMRGVKEKLIQLRSVGYRELLNRTGGNIYRYQPVALGWEGLRNRLASYLKSYKMDGYVGSYIGYGGTDATQQAFLIAREALRKTENPRFDPKVLFSTPGFTFLAKMATSIGMEAVEMRTDPQDDFFYNPRALKDFLADPQNADVRIIVNTPINNPGSTLISAEKILAMQQVLDEYFNKTGRRIIVINDLAYLGTGSTKGNEAIGAALNSYKHRIDVLPLTKIIGRPALRCAGGFTPDENIAAMIPKSVRQQKPAISYPMMLEALAILDFVKKEDIRELFTLYCSRQHKLLELLGERPDLFDINGSYTNWVETTDDDDNHKGALYLYVPVLKDPFDVMAQTGMLATVADTFYLSSGDKDRRYMRFSIGTEPLTQDNLDRMREALKETI